MNQIEDWSTNHVMVLVSEVGMENRSGKQRSDTLSYSTFLTFWNFLTLGEYMFKSISSHRVFTGFTTFSTGWSLINPYCEFYFINLLSLLARYLPENLPIFTSLYTLFSLVHTILSLYFFLWTYVGHLTIK